MKKLNLAILFGGKSAEHSVSINSAKNVVEAASNEKYNIITIGVTKNNKLVLLNKSKLLEESLEEITRDDGKEVTLIPKENNAQIIDVEKGKKKKEIDITFPLLHGPYGEDGTIQGFLELQNTAYVGCEVLGSAIGMDKITAKKLLKQNDIPTPEFIATSNKKINFNDIKEKINPPLFIKPASLGSSVGISKVKSKKEFNSALQKAFKFDERVIIEKGIEGREVECSVLGNKNIKASTLGEIIPKDEDFYSYEAKYSEDSETELNIPAEIKNGIAQEIKETAIRTFKALECKGMARIDFFLTKKGEVFVNEINTIPGFTKFSMYPKLWEESGLSYSKLIDKLVELGLERYQKKRGLEYKR